uniref:Uncharacterized protein n=1 Tax=Rhizophagus irregularis (strain DAOM 181602 / DAOM 197198 / MUCL 43194) TaxID=747089 RepID=U9TUL8_RHIID
MSPVVILASTPKNREITKMGLQIRRPRKKESQLLVQTSLRFRVWLMRKDLGDAA